MVRQHSRVRRKAPTLVTRMTARGVPGRYMTMLDNVNIIHIQSERVWWPTTRAMPYRQQRGGSDKPQWCVRAAALAAASRSVSALFVVLLARVSG